MYNFDKHRILYKMYNLDYSKVPFFHRSRRSVDGTKYIEVVMIVDYVEYSYFHKKFPGFGMQNTQQRALAIMNYVDAYYKTINTRVVVTNLIVWNEKNITPVTSSAHVTLDGKSNKNLVQPFGKNKINRFWI